MFVNRGLFTEEEIKKMCEVNISIPMQESIKTLQEQMKAAQGEVQNVTAEAAKAGKAAIPTGHEAFSVTPEKAVKRVKQAINQVVADAKEQAPTTEDVELASEKNNVIRFPDGKKE